MELNKIDLKQSSNITCDATIAEDNTILCVNVFGEYRSGSKGNPDGLYLFSFLVAYYFVFEPIAIILDLSRLEYTWGNTILKSLNFFTEIGRDTDEKNKSIIIIHSPNNRQAIYDVLKFTIESNRILCKDYDEALGVAIKKVDEYLEKY